MKRLATAMAATGIVMLMAGAAQAVPLCDGTGKYQRCNVFDYKGKTCAQCKSCLSKGGKFLYKNSGPAKFRGLCKLSMKVEKMNRKIPAKPGPVDTSTPLPAKKY